MKPESSRQTFETNIFSKNTHISNFKKIQPVGAEMFHADGQTHRQTYGKRERTKLIVAVRNFSNAPNQWLQLLACLTQQLPRYRAMREA